MLWWYVLYTLTVFLKLDLKNRNLSPCLQYHNTFITLITLRHDTYYGPIPNKWFTLWNCHSSTKTTVRLVTQYYIYSLDNNTVFVYITKSAMIRFWFDSINLGAYDQYETLSIKILTVFFLAACCYLPGARRLALTECLGRRYAWLEMVTQMCHGDFKTFRKDNNMYWGSQFTCHEGHFTWHSTTYYVILWK